MLSIFCLLRIFWPFSIFCLWSIFCPLSMFCLWSIFCPLSVINILPCEKHDLQQVLMPLGRAAAFQSLEVNLQIVSIFKTLQWFRRPAHLAFERSLGRVFRFRITVAAAVADGFLLTNKNHICPQTLSYEANRLMNQFLTFLRSFLVTIVNPMTTWFSRFMWPFHSALLKATISRHTGCLWWGYQ